MINFVKWRRHNAGSRIITLKFTPNRLFRWFGMEPHEEDFVGECTNWYFYPSYRPAPLHLCSTLADYLVMIRNENIPGHESD